MIDHTADVAAVKADLESRGVNLLGACGAFEITSRVAWLLRSEGWGLIFKNPGQNGCSYPTRERYAVDAIMLSGGQVVDMLINSETENTPAWQLKDITDPSLWRQPFERDAGVPVPTPGPVPPAPGPNPTLESRVAQLEAMVAKLLTLGEDHNDSLRELMIVLGHLDTRLARAEKVFDPTHFTYLGRATVTLPIVGTRTFTIPVAATLKPEYNTGG